MTKNKIIYAAFGLLIILEIALYATHGNAFILDDFLTVVRNKHIQGSLFDAVSASPFRAVTVTANWINRSLSDLDALPYHWTNMLFHIIAAIAVFFLIRDFSGANKNQIAAFVGGGWFLMNPFTNFAMLYISARSAILATLFTALAVLFYRRFQDRKKIIYIFIFSLSAVAAAFSKENGFAAVLFIFLLSAKDIRKNKQARVALIICVVLAAAYVIFRLQDRIILGAVSIRLTPYQYLLTQLTVIPMYFVKLLWPAHYSLYFSILKRTGIDLTVILSGVGLVAAWSGAIYAFRRSECIVFFLVWMAISFAPESSVIPFTDLMFAHRAYMPAVAVAALIGYGIEALFQNAGHSGKKIIVSLLAATLVFYAAAGFKLSAPWVSILGIIRQGVSEAPGRYEARHDLGYFLNSKEKYRAALPQLETALRIGAPTSMQTAQTLNLLGKALFNLDDYYGAVLCFNKAMEIDPSHEDPYIKAVMREAMEKAASIQNGNIEDQPK